MTQTPGGQRRLKQHARRSAVIALTGLIAAASLHTTIKTEPIRIVIADSHDLAYEYGKITTEFGLKSGEHVRLEAGLLRVWQKQDGNWKQAAVFTRP